MIKLVVLGITVVVLFVTLICSAHVVPPGNRGVRVLFGSTNSQAMSEGLSFTNPFSDVYDISVRQQTEEMKAECFSSDLQQVDVHIKVLYRIPEPSVVNIFKNYHGDPFKSLVAPRVQEAIKEATATRSAEHIVKEREAVKISTFQLSKAKLLDIVEIDDLIIEDLALSKELELAIEQKMVQEQEAAKAKFTQQKAEIDARTAVIRAQGEAEAIKVRGAALRENPALVQLQIVEKWNGVAPLYVGGGASGANILLPTGK